MPRFSIKDLFLSMTLVASGFAVLIVASKLQPPGNGGMVVVLVSAFALIGAGLFAPFHKKVVGAVIGGWLAFAFMALLYMTVYS